MTAVLESGLSPVYPQCYNAIPVALKAQQREIEDLIQLIGLKWEDRQTDDVTATP